MVCITGKACEEWVFTSCCWFGETIFAAALTYQTAWRWFVLQAKPAKNIPLAKAKPSKSGFKGMPSWKAGLKNGKPVLVITLVDMNY